VTASIASRIAGTFARTAKACAALRDEIAASINPRSAADVRMVDQQLTIARESSSSTVFVLPLAAAAIAYANRHWVPLDRLLIWPFIVALSCMGSEIYTRLLHRSIDLTSDEGVRSRARTFVGMTIVTSFSWTLMSAFLWAPGEVLNHLFLILVLASTISGFTSLGASHFASACVAMPIYLVVQVAMLLTGSDSMDITLAFLFTGFWIIMSGLLYTNYKTRERMLRLEMERGGLINDLRHAKADSDQARDRAETASHAKSAFLANMSHELRTPLNAILGFSEIIHTRALGAAAINQYAEYGGFIHDSGKHLLALINDILDLAKIEAGRLSLREEEVDLRRLIADATQMLTVKADAAEILLTADTAANLPNVYADERALRQIVVNLLSNALKFTPPSGHISAFAQVMPNGEISFGVSDNGVGIEPEDQLKVFESFGQGRHDAVIADQGTGLGLPIVKGLAEAHGGRVVLESAAGRGTRVTITLPAERIRERRSAAAA
jgi:two-component system cell cycle sensor histidine kinase PleC